MVAQYRDLPIAQLFSAAVRLQRVRDREDIDAHLEEVVMREAALRAAIQAAQHYPESARMAVIAGRFPAPRWHGVGRESRRVERRWTAGSRSAGCRQGRRAPEA